jgi:hypothetical protein
MRRKFPLKSRRPNFCWFCHEMADKVTYIEKRNFILAVYGEKVTDLQLADGTLNKFADLLFADRHTKKFTDL